MPLMVKAHTFPSFLRNTNIIHSFQQILLIESKSSIQAFSFMVGRQLKNKSLGHRPPKSTIERWISGFIPRPFWQHLELSNTMLKRNCWRVFDLLHGPFLSLAVYNDLSLKHDDCLMDATERDVVRHGSLTTAKKSRPKVLSLCRQRANLLLVNGFDVGNRADVVLNVGSR